MSIHERPRHIPAFALRMLHAHAINILASFSLGPFERHIAAAHDPLPDVIETVIGVFHVGGKCGVVAVVASGAAEELPVDGAYHGLFRAC